MTDQERRIKQGLFLAEYAEGHSVTYSADKAGITRMSVWKWRRDYADFDEAYQHARLSGLDRYEDKLWSIAFNDERRDQVAAINAAARIRSGMLVSQDAIHHQDDTIGTMEELAQTAIDKGYILPPSGDSE